MDAKTTFIGLGVLNILSFVLGIALKSDVLLTFWFVSYPIPLGMIVWAAITGRLRNWIN